MLQADPPQGIIDLAGASVARNSLKREHGLDITVSLLHLNHTFRAAHLTMLQQHY